MTGIAGSEPLKMGDDGLPIGHAVHANLSNDTRG
jgi:hypothetical protein